MSSVDEKGELIDGDKILAIFSKYMKSMGILKNNTCVVTVMTNLGFFKYAKGKRHCCRYHKGGRQIRS